MIPHRVLVKNFLCYHEQEFFFEDHPVWLLHGPNGVGKSAVFDAIVYALFGEHHRRSEDRGAVADLIRYGEKSMRVEFDFECGGRRYRAWRTRTRAGQPKQGVSELTPSGWVGLRDVNNASEVEKWVTGTLGVTFETFVSAVLLRQGAAERLIDADRDARRDVLRGIIDLESYIRLHSAVTTARTETNAAVRAEKARLASMPEVTEADVTAAAAAAVEAEDDWVRSRDAEVAMRDHIGHARVWESLDGDLRAVRARIAAAADRAARATELERAVQRLWSLRIIVPALAQIRELRQNCTDTEAKYQSLIDAHAVTLGRQEEGQDALKREREKIESHRNRADELGRSIAVTNGRLDRLREQISQADRAADLRRQLADQQSKLAGFGTDLDARLSDSERAAVESQAARDAHPYLDAIHQSRTSYLKACDRRTEAERAQEIATKEMNRLESAESHDQDELASAEERAQLARESLAVAESLSVTAGARLQRFLAVADASVCSACGQPIDADHAARELAELEQNVRESAARVGACRTESDAAACGLTIARQIAEEALVERQKLRSVHDDAVRVSHSAEAEKHEARKAFDAARGKLPIEWAEHVAQIEADGFPTDADVRGAGELAKLTPIRNRTRDNFVARRQEREQVNSSIGVLEQAVSALGGPADVGAAREDRTSAERELESFTRERDEAESGRSESEKAERLIIDSLAEIATELTRLAGELGSASEAKKNARSALDAAFQQLSPGVTSEDTNNLTDELRQLETLGVERDFDAIAGDRILGEEWARQAIEFEHQIATRIPAESRRPAAELEEARTAAERAVRDADGVRGSTARALKDATDRRDARDAVRVGLVAAERDYRLHDELASLLGPDGIQRDLVRQAENRIMELANDVLVQVSLGELRLDPPDPTGDRSFDIQVRRVGCPDPIAVGNLSGGQRCRVALSLALAVCRFACGQSRPLECIIIDEAFANLDREGRMAMIEVIRAGGLAGDLLKRILIVSHHEDVAAAFTVGYRFANNAGTTTVARLN